MKRLCKDICIYDRDLVLRAVAKCMSKPSTRRRHDTVKYFAEAAGVSRDVAAARLEAPGEGRDLMYELVADRLSEDIRRGDFACKTPKVKSRKDPSSGKVRDISVLHIRQLLLDHVAVEALKPVLSRIGAFQCAGVPGRGTVHGLKAVRRWVHKKGMRYFVQMDIVKFYPSVDKARLMEWLRNRVGNPRLLCLVRSLLYTCGNGVHIGSYLSQTLCTVYTSDIYHMVKERLTEEVTRRGETKAKPLASHILMYMDDILLIGANRRRLLKAAQEVDAFISNVMGLMVKPYRVRDLNTGECIDALGYRIYRKHTTMRRQIAKRARRYAVRAGTILKANGRIPLSLARRIVSYHGWVHRTDSRRFSRRNGWWRSFRAASIKVSNATIERK